MGFQWLLIWATAGPTGPMAISKRIVLALDLRTLSSSRSPLAFNLGPQLAQEVPGYSEGVSLTFDLGDLVCPRGQLSFACSMGLH